MGNECKEVLYLHFETINNKTFKKEIAKLNDSMNTLYELTVGKEINSKQFLYDNLEDAIKKFNDFDLSDYDQSLRFISFNIDRIYNKVESYRQLRKDYAIIIKHGECIKTIRYDSKDNVYVSESLTGYYHRFKSILNELFFTCDYPELEFKFITLGDFE